MSSTATTSSNFQAIFDAALSDYAKQTGIDLATHPFAQTLQNCDSADEIFDLLRDKANQFQAYREGNRKLISCLKPVVQILHTVAGILGEAATLVSPARFVFSECILLLYFQLPFQPTKAILVSVDVLLTVRIAFTSIKPRLYHHNIWVFQASMGVSSSYDALVDLFECVGNFLNRLSIYTKIPFSPSISGIITKIMAEVLSVLSLAMKQIKQGRLSE
jgi:fungal STAND N-terminal Goodbye domain